MVKSREFFFYLVYLTCGVWSPSFPPILSQPPTQTQDKIGKDEGGGGYRAFNRLCTVLMYCILYRSHLGDKDLRIVASIIKIPKPNRNRYSDCFFFFLHYKVRPLCKCALYRAGQCKLFSFASDMQNENI